MPESPLHLSERLLDEGQKTLKFFSDWSEGNWGLIVYNDGSSWNVQQILAHFVSAEAGFLSLIKDVLNGGSGAAEDFDIDSYNQESVARMQNTPVAELSDQFWSLRQKNAEIVSKMTSDDLDRRGRHPFLGEATLRDMIKLIYRHNQIHLRDIRRAMG